MGYPGYIKTGLSFRARTLTFYDGNLIDHEIPPQKVMVDPHFPENNGGGACNGTSSGPRRLIELVDFDVVGHMLL